MYSDETLFQKDTYTPIFIAALFIIAKTGKQPKKKKDKDGICTQWNIIQP